MSWVPFVSDFSICAILLMLSQYLILATHQLSISAQPSTSQFTGLKQRSCICSWFVNLGQAQLGSSSVGLTWIRLCCYLSAGESEGEMPTRGLTGPAGSVPCPVPQWWWLQLLGWLELSLHVIPHPQTAQPGFPYTRVTGHQEGESRHPRPNVTSTTFCWSKQLTVPAQIRGGGRANSSFYGKDDDFTLQRNMHLVMEEIAETMLIIYHSHQSFAVINDPSFPLRMACPSVAGAEGNSKSGFLWLSKLGRSFKQKYRINTCGKPPVYKHILYIQSPI